MNCPLTNVSSIYPLLARTTQTPFLTKSAGSGECRHARGSEEKLLRRWEIRRRWHCLAASTTAPADLRTSRRPLHLSRTEDRCMIRQPRNFRGPNNSDERATALA